MSIEHSPGRGKRMLRFRDVVERTGLSRTTLWRHIRAGTFPASMQLGRNSVGWTEQVIDDHVDSLPTVQYAGQEADAA